MMKKKICTLLMLLGLGIFSAGTIAGADDTGTEVKAETETEATAEAGTENESEADAADTLDYKSLGYTVKNTDHWDGVKGTIFIYPASSTAILDDPDLYLASIYYIPASEEDMSTDEKAEAFMSKMTMPSVIFSINGDRDQLLEDMVYLGFMDEVSEDDLETDLVQVGEADGYKFFLLSSLEDDYAAGLDPEFAEDYRNLPAIFERELKQAKFYAPIDPMKSLEGIVLKFTTTDLDGNTVTSEDLFKDNEITMVNAWGTWCGNCVNEMEELAAIHNRLKEKGCGVVGIEYEETPDEATYQSARDLMKEKGTNYPNVIMPDDNEILNLINGFPTTLFVDREGKILTKPIVGAKVDKYEPTVEALLKGSAVTPETENAEARTYTYRVLVKDENDQPLQEVTVQFCDDVSCRYGETDEQGCVVFEVPEEKAYDVHIAEASDEYEYDPEEIIKTDAVSSDTTVVLKKAK